MEEFLLTSGHCSTVQCSAVRGRKMATCKRETIKLACVIPFGADLLRFEANGLETPPPPPPESRPRWSVSCPTISYVVSCTSSLWEERRSTLHTYMFDAFSLRPVWQLHFVCTFECAYMLRSLFAFRWGDCKEYRVDRPPSERVLIKSKH